MSSLLISKSNYFINLVVFNCGAILLLRQDTCRIPIVLGLYLLEMPFYAVAVGKVPGVYKTWEECQNQTKGHPKAKFRKFNTAVEASEFVRTKGFKNVDVPHNTSVTSSRPLMVENVKLPELKKVSKYPSQMLNQDRLSAIAEKLDSFIEKTNKKLSEFSNRLDIIETSIFCGNTSGDKRKIEITDDITEKKKPKKTLSEIKVAEDEETENTNNRTRSRTRAANGPVEEVDGPWSYSGRNLSAENFIVDGEGYTIVYTDGACSNNGKQGAKAGIGVWFNHSNPFNVAAPVEGVATNNNAEIQAATRAIQQANLAGVKRLNIHTDSQFMINCITDWIKKWKKNKWMTSNGGAVKNKEQLVILDTALQSLDAVKWTYVRGHMGLEGNECADALARNGATLY